MGDAAIDAKVVDWMRWDRVSANRVFLEFSLFLLFHSRIHSCFVIAERRDSEGDRGVGRERRCDCPASAYDRPVDIRHCRWLTVLFTCCKSTSQAHVDRACLQAFARAWRRDSIA